MTVYIDSLDNTRILRKIESTPKGVRCKVYWRQQHGEGFEPLADTLKGGFGGYATIPASLFEPRASYYGFRDFVEPAPQPLRQDRARRRRDEDDDYEGGWG